MCPNCYEGIHTIAKFKYFKNSSTELTFELINDLYNETKDNKVLIFPNTRGRVEEIAVKLKKTSDRMKGHSYYFSHHSSVDKEIREYIEHFVKNNERLNFCISCTSTLELGIDIGTVDKIVQIDSTHSVASLVQRIGRSGRNEGEKSIVNIYATNKWSFLQALACWQLYLIDFFEPVETTKKSYDILLHQMLSIVKQFSGCKKNDLINCLNNNYAFNSIEINEIQNIIDESIKSDILEVVQNEIILGLEGEKIVNSKEFYSVFKTEHNLKIYYSGRKIGDIPYSAQIKIDENILLAAKIWKIIDVDLNNAKIYVIPAADGKKPKFFGEGNNIHPKIREEMLRIIISNTDYNEINEPCKIVLKDLRSEFKNFKINNFENDRPIILKDNKLIFYTFSGTKINRSLYFLMAVSDISTSYYENNSTFEIDIDLSEFDIFKSKLNNEYKLINNYIEKEILNNKSILGFSKWGIYLPLKYQCEIVKEQFFDFEGAISFINNVNLVVIN